MPFPLDILSKRSELWYNNLTNHLQSSFGTGHVQGHQIMLSQSFAKNFGTWWVCVHGRNFWRVQKYDSRNLYVAPSIHQCRCISRPITEISGYGFIEKLSTGQPSDKGKGGWFGTWCPTCCQVCMASGSDASVWCATTPKKRSACSPRWYRFERKGQDRHLGCNQGSWRVQIGKMRQMDEFVRDYICARQGTTAFNRSADMHT